MVSFQCDACADTVKKPKLDQHRSRCFSSFTCLDCSTTFRNPSEYKSHTTCVTEAEKYQGALYKGPKKGQNQPQSSAQASPAPAPTPAPEPTPAPIATIHPSRLQQMGSTAPDYFDSSFRSAGRGRGARGGARGGRGGFGGRGGYGGGQQVERSYASDMNKIASEVGMRSWGGSPAASPAPGTTPAAPAAHTSFADAAPVPAPGAGFSAGAEDAVSGKKAKKDKFKQRKGDKGGTGAKANSKNPKPTSDAPAPAPTPAPAPVAAPVAVTDAEPSNKKRKRDDSTSAPLPSTSSSSTPADTTEVSSKTIKRLKKKLSKLELGQGKAKEMSLAEFVDSIGGGDEKKVESGDVLKGVKVVFKDGAWQLSV
ncbi:hypothetical protein IAT38_000367 [Cryptococcus sp. DSM 104549]